MSESQVRILPGSTGRWSGYLQKDDGTKVLAADIDSGYITLTDAATGEVIRNNVQFHNGTSALGDFDVTEATVEIDGADVAVTILGWHIQTTDTELQTAGISRESHVGVLTITYTDGSESKTLVHTVRLECVATLGACTANDVLDMLVNVQEDDPTRDLIERMIEAMTVRFEGICRRRFAKSTVASPTVEVQGVGVGTSTLWLDRYPIDSVVSVKEDVDGNFASGAVLSPSDYYVNAARGLLELRRFFLLPGRGTVQVTYAGGLYLETGACPMDIREACARQVAFQWEGRSRLGVNTQSAGGVSTTRFTVDLLDDVKDVLRLYKRARY